jgi:hypothetical protein
MRMILNLQMNATIHTEKALAGISIHQMTDHCDFFAPLNASVDAPKYTRFQHKFIRSECLFH